MPFCVAIIYIYIIDQGMTTQSLPTLLSWCEDVSTFAMGEVTNPGMAILGEFWSRSNMF